MERNRIQRGELKVGEPLPWPVTDEQGRLLLRKGYVISSQTQIDVLVARGIYSVKTDQIERSATPAVEEQRQSPFHVFDQFQVRLKRICDDLKSGTQAEIPERIFQFCQDLQRLCRMDSDAVLGAVHLIHEGRYTILHSLHTAILTELFLRALSISDEDRLPILAAALTRDAGMMDLQEVLYRQQEPLSAEQLAEIRKHPLRTAAMLESVGVVDGIWLDTVLHHHERLDGTGYPHGLKDEDIFFPARILAIVDIYGAMIKQRAYRNALAAREVLRDIFLQRAGEVDANLAKIFVKELGVFPPGVFVRLQNCEVAVVTHRGKTAACPIAQSILGPRGAPLPKPIKRDTSVGEFAIREVVPRDRTFPLNLHSLWGYV
jgi:HD-GYP domain-containing protein (c-di-GMP phosphodiesterase class II)